MHIELDVLEILVIITWFIFIKWLARFFIMLLGVKVLNGIKRKSEEKIQGIKDQFKFDSKNDSKGDMEN